MSTLKRLFCSKKSKAIPPIHPDENNKISLSVSSNWVTVPIYREDSGKQVRVIVTPVYKSVTDRNITFNIGSYMQFTYTS